MLNYLKKLKILIIKILNMRMRDKKAYTVRSSDILI